MKSVRNFNFFWKNDSHSKMEILGCDSNPKGSFLHTLLGLV
jgi:hypothetical protein